MKYDNELWTTISVNVLIQTIIKLIINFYEIFNKHDPLLSDNVFFKNFYII